MTSTGCGFATRDCWRKLGRAINLKSSSPTITSACGLHGAGGSTNRVVVPAPVQGAGPARNAGVAAAMAPVIALIDSDCVPEPDWIAEGAAV